MLTSFLIGCGYNSVTIENSKEVLLLDSIAHLYHKGEINPCIKLGESFVTDYPNNDKGWHLLSSAFLAKGNDSIAKVCARNAIKINPNNHIALSNYGILLDKKGKYEEASVFYEKSLSSNNQLAQTYSNYALNRLRADDFANAIVFGEIAVKLAGNIKDKGILCLSYHKSGYFVKRDSLFNELKNLNYENLSSLEELIYN